MAEGVLEREYIHSSSYRLRGMAVPQLVWMDVESSSTSPFAANISNCLACEVSNLIANDEGGLVKTKPLTWRR